VSLHATATREGRDRERGAVAVELALLLPVLVVIIGGVIDVGAALTTRVQLQEAVQDGVTFASHTPNNPAATRTRVAEASSGLSTGSVTVTCTGSNPTVVTVRAVRSHTWLSGMLPLPPLIMTAEISSDVLSTTTCVSG
jgi:Flp pilus assembly protein TadG